MTQWPAPPPQQLVVRVRDPARVWAIGTAVSSPAAYVLAFVVQILVREATGENYLFFIGIAFAYSIVAIAVSYALFAISFLASPRNPRHIALAAALGGLVGLLPISAVLFLRLSAHTCTVLNPFWLPWAEPWREIAHWGAGAICLAATVALFVGIRNGPLQRPAVAMWVAGGILAVPAFFLFFLSVYGDPIAGCVPV